MVFPEIRTRLRARAVKGAESTPEMIPQLLLRQQVCVAVHGAGEGGGKQSFDTVRGVADEAGELWLLLLLQVLDRTDRRIFSHFFDFFIFLFWH